MRKPIPKSVRKQVYAKYNGHCAYCGCEIPEKGFNVDHLHCLRNYECVKGGMGYWNRIRKDFPEVFASRAKLEREVGHSMLKDKNGPVYLDELDPDRGDMNTEIMPECGIMCYLSMK